MAKLLVKMFLMFLAAAGFIGYDISSNGSLESSRTGRTLRNCGVLIYVKPYYSIVEEQTLLLYKWGKKNFPYEDFNRAKNRTIEVSKDLKKKISAVAETSYDGIKARSVIVYLWVADLVSPYLSDRVIAFFTEGYIVVLEGCKKIEKFMFEGLKWCKENIKWEKITWENFEKAYFGAAQQVKVCYSNVSNWISRKVVCLMKS